ncbi:MAG TPA: NAD(P)/FAD-dependent oxidoreductase [Sedimentisphaerales bacterium]|nr:NAD(P)/FAD-dependent oxidoreductase [Sedimentisphaerales bacterium]
MSGAVGIIGAGAAGLMAAVFAAQVGAEVVVIESNTSAGRKLLKTGGGRCNLTNFTKTAELLKAYRPYDKFLRYSLYEFSPEDVIQFFNTRNINTCVEPNGSVFPASNRANDILDVLTRECQKLKVKFLYDKKVSDILKVEDGFIVKAANKEITFRSIIIATGGASWSVTGSTGDGYRLAENLGHKVVTPRASLVPLVTSEKWVKYLAGVALDNIRISANIENKKVSAAGALVFTSTGIGGPAVLNFSRMVVDRLISGALPISIDILPEYNFEQLFDVIKKSCEENSKKDITTVISFLLPRSVACEIYNITDADQNLKAGQLSRNLCHKICSLIKALPVTIIAARSLQEATITRGGVDTSEIDDKTMQSKLVKGLFFAGEVIDADGPCGGYNLQIAWSTGALAGKSAAAALNSNI